MKSFAVWLAMTLAVFGGMSGGYHVYLNGHPRQVAVAVDASFSMKSVWHQVPKTLSRIEKQRYSRFALFTEKGRVHTWAARLDLSKTTPYAPRNLNALADTGKYPELDSADVRILITNAPDAEMGSVRGWKVVRVGR